jgi:phage terminase large subunit-like protein
VPADGGRLQVFAADDRTGDGIIPGGIALVDELHRHRDLRLYRVWVGKLVKRGAQIVTISTAGSRRRSSRRPASGSRRRRLTFRSTAAMCGRR